MERAKFNSTYVSGEQRLPRFHNLIGTKLHSRFPELDSFWWITFRVYLREKAGYADWRDALEDVVAFRLHLSDFLFRAEGAKSRHCTNRLYSLYFIISKLYLQPPCNLCVFSWHQEYKMKFKELSPIKWRPQSIFFTRSVAFVVGIIPLNKIFVQQFLIW